MSARLGLPGSPFRPRGLWDISPAQRATGVLCPLQGPPEGWRAGGRWTQCPLSPTSALVEKKIFLFNKIKKEERAWFSGSKRNVFQDSRQPLLTTLPGALSLEGSRRLGKISMSLTV